METELLTIWETIAVGAAFFIMVTIALWVMLEDLIGALILSPISLLITFGCAFLIYFDLKQSHQQYQLVSKELKLDPSEIIYEDDLWYTNSGVYKIQFATEGLYDTKSIDKIVKTGDLIKP